VNSCHDICAMLQANLVIKYNTTFQDAVAGARPKNGEISLRCLSYLAALACRLADFYVR